jgi:hypothetical protein
MGDTSDKSEPTMSRRLARDSSRVDEWERATRTMAMLATKLRLTPQIRIDGKTLGRQQISHETPPWERERRDGYDAREIWRPVCNSPPPCPLPGAKRKTYARIELFRV